MLKRTLLFAKLLSLESALCLRQPQRSKEPTQTLPGATCPGENHLEQKNITSLMSKVLWLVEISCPVALPEQLGNKPQVNNSYCHRNHGMGTHPSLHHQETQKHIQELSWSQRADESRSVLSGAASGHGPCRWHIF